MNYEKDAGLAKMKNADTRYAQEQEREAAGFPADEEELARNARNDARREKSNKEFDERLAKQREESNAAFDARQKGTTDDGVDPEKLKARLIKNRQFKKEQRAKKK
jgi:hypothetical protein